MKPILWIPITAVLVIGAVFLASRPISVDASPDAIRQYIAEIPMISGVQSSGFRSLDGDAILGGSVEKGIRRFFGIACRESPLQIKEHQFATNAGQMVVCIHEVDQRVWDIVIVASDFNTSPAKEVSRSLREMVPNIPVRQIHQEAEQVAP